MSKKTYSLKKDGEIKLTENFLVREFKCNDGSDSIIIDSELPKVLQKIRDHFKKPVIINSAYRTEKYNKSIGGVSGSHHVKGNAADIAISGINPNDIAEFCEHIMKGYGGIGLYKDFVHIDVRKNKSRWKNYGKEVVVSGFFGYKEKFELDTVNDIVWELCERQVICEKSLWLKKLKFSNNPYYLAKMCANKTINRKKHLNLTSVNDIIWELSHRKIITDTKLWTELFEKDKDIYWLGRKICNMTENKN